MLQNFQTIFLGRLLFRLKMMWKVTIFRCNKFKSYTLFKSRS